jgi:WD40 repeat protein
VRGVLDEELQRLPERYRAPLVLCYLEGKTRDEAAHLLGWSTGKLHGLLERGRERLRARLLRRGLTLSAALFGTALAQAAPSALPAPLIASIVKASTLFAAGKPAAVGGISAPVISITERVLHAMVLTKVKIAAGALLACGIAAAGAGVLTHHALSEQRAAAGRPTPPKLSVAGVDQPKPGPAEEKPARTDRFGDPLPPDALARLGTVRFRHGPSVALAVFSPDGKLLAMSDWQSISLWDAATGRELRRFPSAGTLLAFSPDSKLLAVCDRGIRAQDGKLRLLDVATGEVVRQLEGHQGPVGSAAFAPDGKSLASGGMDGTVRLWDTATGTELRRLEGHQKGISSVAFAPDGKILASGSWGEADIRLWDVATGKERGRLTGHKGSVWSVAFGPGGTMLASGGEDKTIRLWDVATWKEMRVLGGNATAVIAVAFSPDGKLLASGGSYDTIALWDVSAGKELRRWQPPVFDLRLGGFSPDGKTLASSSLHECAPRLWDLATGRQVGPLGGHHGPTHGLTFGPDGKTLISSERERLLMLRWDLATGREVETFSRQLRKVVRSALSPDGKTLATWERWENEVSVRLWDVATGQERRLLGKHKWESYGTTGAKHPLAFTPDGKQVASVDRERVVLWDVATGRQVRDFLGLKGEIHCVAFTPDGRTLAAGIRRGGIQTIRTILLWDVATGKELQAFGHEEEAVEFLTFSPDGKLLASACWGLPVRLWDMATGKERLVLTDLEKGVWDVAFSPDGRLLAGADTERDKAVCLCEVLTGQEVSRFIGEKIGVLCVAFAPDGRTLASGSADSSILLWDATGRGGRRSGPVSDAQAEALWADLAGADAARAYAAVWRLVDDPRRALSLLRERLQPIAPPPPDQVRALLNDLDSDRFPMREAARRRLRELGEVVEPALRNDLKGKPSLERRQQVEALLAALNEVPGPEKLRQLRSVAVLEHIGSPEARQVLKALASGAPEARLTQEAKASLDRQARRPLPAR